MADARGRTVLLVEDHPINREVLARQLALAGFDADTAADGLQALQYFASGSHALVLTDLQMPGLDGFQLAAAIRALERARGQPRTPILAVTAATDPEQVERCRAAGIDDCLAKPVTILLLAAQLGRWLPHAPRATPALGSPVTDAALRELAGSDPIRIRELLRRYCDTAFDDLRALDEALHARHGQIADVAHRMKGAALMIGAREVAALAEAVEQHARGAPAADFADASSALRLAVERVRQHAGRL